MFVALDESGALVGTENAHKGEKYFCRFCGGELRVRAESSTKVTKHFAHIHRSECDSWTSDMSEWHLNWQKQFPIECREVVMSNGTEKHRADVFINGVVIEFQHSPIDRKEFDARNNFYLSKSYRVVWVFDVTGKIKHVLDTSIIDPTQCTTGQGLCWKRKWRLFENLDLPKNEPGVEIYLQFTFEEPGGSFERKKAMILLSEIDEKKFIFHKTETNIQEGNFLKEYGAIDDDEIPSVSDMIDEYTKHHLNRWQR